MSRPASFYLIVFLLSVIYLRHVFLILTADICIVAIQHHNIILVPLPPPHLHFPKYFSGQLLPLPQTFRLVSAIITPFGGQLPVALILPSIHPPCILFSVHMWSDVLVINPCLRNSFGCTHACTVVNDLPVCSCPPGFVLDADLVTCTGIWLTSITRVWWDLKTMSSTCVCMMLNVWCT